MRGANDFMAFDRPLDSTYMYLLHTSIYTGAAWESDIAAAE